jgi:hypothetical protein
MTLRLYNPRVNEWNLYGSYNGKTIWIRSSFYNIGRASARDEQAFSEDGRRTRQINWISVHARY